MPNRPPLSRLSSAASRHSSASLGCRERSSYSLATDDDEDDGVAKLPYEALVHFTNSDAVVELATPWKVASPKTMTGTGFFIGQRRLLTNSHVVHAATSLRVFRHGVSGNYAARVLCESAVCDLALVTVDDDSFWSGFDTIITFQEKVPALDDEVCAVGYPLGAKSVTNTRGVVSNVRMWDLSLFNEQEKQLEVQIDAAINPGNSGGPVFNKETGEVVGVAFSGRDDAEGNGFIIPTPVVFNFLDVYASTGTFGRLPNLGISTQSLESAAMRALLFEAGTKPPSHHDGVLITHVRPWSCAEAAGVLAGDILMAIDGQAVSEQGEVTFRGHEKVDFEYLITRRKNGETVKLRLLRNPNSRKTTFQPSDRTAPSTDGRKSDGALPAEPGSAAAAPAAPFDINVLVEHHAMPQPVELSVTLAPTNDLVPRELYKDYHPEYAIVGGLVFVIAGLPLMDQSEDKEAWGLYHEVRDLLFPPYAERDDDAAAAAAAGAAKRQGPPKDAQALLCSSVLAHEVNEGFANLAIAERLHKVNSVVVRNMRHLVELLSPLLDPSVQPPPRSHVVLQFACPRASVVFEVQALRDSTPVILEQHKVPSWTNAKLPTSAEEVQ